MPRAITIIHQPGQNSMHAAYRPVTLQIRVGGETAPPVVYCDVYFGGIFYKTLIRTQPLLKDDTQSIWKFDIQEAGQEYLKKFLGANGGSAVLYSTLPFTPTFCRFRASDYNGNGFIEPEGAIPIQGTGKKDPASGDGQESNLFYLVNATLQHEHNQDLAAHLSYQRRGEWNEAAFPLTHRPKTQYKVGLDQSDYYPIVFLDDLYTKCLRLNYKNKGQVVWHKLQWCDDGCNLKVENVSIVPILALGKPRFYASWELPNGRPAMANEQLIVEVNTGNGWVPAEIVSILFDYCFYTLDVAVSHQVRVTPICNNGIAGTPGVGNYVKAPGNCEPVAIIQNPQLPDAIIGQPYEVSIDLGGTAPFGLSAIVKPAWMNIVINGSSIRITGQPSALASNVNVSFTISNCDNATVNFADQINVVNIPEHLNPDQYHLNQTGVITGICNMDGGTVNRSAIAAEASAQTGQRVKVTIRFTSDGFQQEEQIKEYIFEVAAVVANEPLGPVDLSGGGPCSQIFNEIISVEVIP